MSDADLQAGSRGVEPGEGASAERPPLARNALIAAGLVVLGGIGALIAPVHQLWPWLVLAGVSALATGYTADARWRSGAKLLLHVGIHWAVFAVGALAVTFINVFNSAGGSEALGHELVPALFAITLAHAGLRFGWTALAAGIALAALYTVGATAAPYVWIAGLLIGIVLVVALILRNAWRSPTRGIHAVQADAAAD